MGHALVGTVTNTIVFLSIVAQENGIDFVIYLQEACYFALISSPRFEIMTWLVFLVAPIAAGSANIESRDLAPMAE